MGEKIELLDDELAALEALILEPSRPRAWLMNNLAARGLVWRTGRSWTLSQAGWRAVRGHRWGTGRGARGLQTLHL